MLTIVATDPSRPWQASDVLIDVVPADLPHIRREPDLARAALLGRRILRAQRRDLAEWPGAWEG